MTHAKECKLNNYYQLHEEQLDVFYRAAMHFLGYGLEQHMILRASAGTGKSFTAKALLEFLESNGIPITKVAFTGRAASRIGAQTCHSLLYEPMLDSNGDLIRWQHKHPQVLRESIGYGIAVDEGSMISKDMHQELTEIGVPILYIGDHAQLDPVEINQGGWGAPKNDNPFNVMTSLPGEVVTLLDMRRFNPDSGIAEIAEKLREANTIKRIKRKDVQFVSKAAINKPEFFKNTDIDVIVCGTNKTRKRLTQVYREGEGWEWDGLPATGETIMCLKNDVIGGVKIYNGELYKILWVGPGQDHGRYMLLNNDYDEPKTITVDILNETWESEAPPRRVKDGPKYGHFTFGYVLTCHKCQGSSIDTVLFVDENVSFFTSQQKFRYTGITRAAKKVYIAI